MRALVVGGEGFVGKYLIEALLQRGYETHLTALSAPEKVSYGAEAHVLDITRPHETETLLGSLKPDVIFHLAAQSSVRLSWKDPRLTAEVNAVGAAELLEGIRSACPSARVLIVGSSEEYGQIDYSSPICEDTRPNPTNPYALTKLFQESLAGIYAKAYGLHVVMTRSFNHIGPGQSTMFAVADFCSQVAAIEAGESPPVIRVGNLSACRDFTDVRDVVRAYLILAERGADGEVYNVGRGHSYKLQDILTLILSMSPMQIDVQVDSAKFRPLDVPDICADISKLRALGWSPRISLEETVSDTLNYFRRIQTP